MLIRCGKSRVQDTALAAGLMQAMRDLLDKIRQFHIVAAGGDEKNTALPHDSRGKLG